MNIQKNNSIAIAVDLQEKIFPVINHKEQIIAQSCKLLKGLYTLNIPIVYTEQYPAGLGYTINEVKKVAGDDFKPVEKKFFSCYKVDPVRQILNDSDKEFIILFGIESHVCVMQTALDLIENYFIPVIVEDCTGSRYDLDKSIAIERLRQSGAIITSCESLLMELLEGADSPEFKSISKLIK